MRYEHLEQEQVDNDEPENSDTNDLDVFGGGLGVTYDVSDEWTFFGGVHRGFSPPSPRDAINYGLEEETSLGSELGSRYLDARGAISVGATAFFTQFNDLLVVDNVGGSGTGESENIGEVDSYGVEFAADFDAGWDFKNP